MGNPGCGPEAVVVVRAGEPVPTHAELARLLAPVVDARDLDRAVANGSFFLGLVGRTVLGWQPVSDDGGPGLEWWTPGDDRKSYEALVISLDGDEEAVLARGDIDEFAIIRSTLRPRRGALPTDPTGPGRPALGRIDRGALILHTHRQPPPYRERLTLQFALEIGGRSWVLMAAEGYELDEWSVFDDCVAIRRPVDDRWPLP